MNDQKAGFPVIELTVQDMRHTIRTVLAGYLQLHTQEIQREIDRVCTPEYVRGIVHATAEKEIRATIEEEISNFYRYGKGRTAIADEVRQRLERGEP